MYCLSLDISTTCTGMCVLRIDDFLLCEYEAIKLDAYNDINLKSQKLIGKIDFLLEKYDITLIAIEECLTYMRFTKANSLLKLGMINGIVTYHLYKFCGLKKNVKLIKLYPISVKSKLGIKVDKQKGENKKILFLDYMIKNVGNSLIVKHSSKNKINKSMFDIADAYCLAMAAIKHVTTPRESS